MSAAAAVLLLKAESSDGGLEATDLLGSDAADLSVQAVMAALANIDALNQCLERRWLELHRDDATTPPIWLVLTAAGDDALSESRGAA